MNARRRTSSRIRHKPGATAALPGLHDRERLLVLAMAALYFTTYSLVCIVKHRYYLYLDSDLAIFTQATDRLLQGSLYNSIRGMNWLGDHVSLILLLIAPLYAFIRHPLTLLLLQTLVLALGAFPVHALARRALGRGGPGPAFAGLYLLYPALGYTNLYEFHPEVLATTTVLAVFASLVADRFAPTVAFAGLSLACKEDVAPLILMVGLWAFLPGRSRRMRFGLTLLAMAVGSLLLTFAVIRPAAGTAGADYGVMYRQWGSTATEIVLGLARDPLGAISAFFTTPGEPFDTMLKRQYWILMLAPVLFLPLLSPWTLAVTLPILAEHFLSFRPNQHRIVFHYTALVTPVVMVAAVEGLANVHRILSRGRAVALPIHARRGATWGLMVLALACSLACNLVYGALLRQDWTLVAQGASEAVWPTAEHKGLRPFRDRMVEKVPGAGGLVASSEFLARFASREDVHSLHHVLSGRYTFSNKPYPLPRGVTAVLGNLANPLLVDYFNPTTYVAFRDLVAANHLRPVEAAGENLLFLRDPPDTIDLVRLGVAGPPKGRRILYDGQLSFEGANLPTATTKPGQPLLVETFWRTVAAVDHHFLLHLLVRESGGTQGFSFVRHLGYLLYPPVTWPAGTTARETYRLMMPAGLKPGRYTLQIRVASWRGGRSALSRPDDPTLAGRNYLVDLGTFTVVGSR